MPQGADHVRKGYRGGSGEGKRGLATEEARERAREGWGHRGRPATGQRQTTTRHEGWGREGLGVSPHLQSAPGLGPLQAPLAGSPFADRSPEEAECCSNTVARRSGSTGEHQRRRHYLPRPGAGKPRVFPKSARPPPSTTSHSCQKGGSHRVPQVSEAHVARAQEQRVVSLEVRAVSRSPCTHPAPSPFRSMLLVACLPRSSPPNSPLFPSLRTGVSLPHWP